MEGSLSNAYVVLITHTFLIIVYFINCLMMATMDCCCGKSLSPLFSGYFWNHCCKMPLDNDHVMLS